MGGKKDFRDYDYDEGNWLENACLWLIDAIDLAMLFLVKLWCKIFVPKKKRIASQIAYLEGNAIREGEFDCLALIPFSMLKERRELIKNKLQFLFWKEPHLLIGLINLKAGEKEKAFFDEIMSEIFSFSKQNLTLATSKILGGEMSVESKTFLVSYLAQKVTEEKREYFINFFRKTFKEMGDPIKKEIERVIGEEL